MNLDPIQSLAKRADTICKAENWRRDWEGGGCYLMLESAEFIESLRGKGDSSPTEEAADVLFVLLAMLSNHNIPVSDVITKLEENLSNMERSQNGN